MYKKMVMNGSIFLLLISVQLLNPVSVISTELDLNDINATVPPQFKINSEIPINIVFIGFDETTIDTVQIDEDLTHWYAPLINQWNYPYMGMNYSFDVNYFMSTPTLEQAYYDYLMSIASADTTPNGDLLKYDSTATSALYFDAYDAITWLNKNINTYFPGLNSSYTFYFIDTYTDNYIIDYYYYTLDYTDPDTGQLTLEPYTTFYGGDWPNRGIFMDLSAGPVYYYENNLEESNEGVSPTTIPPIWSYTFPTDKILFNDNLAEYIQETIDMVYTPSYIYDPVIREDFEVVIYFFDDATVSQADQIDINVIYDSFKFLYPTLNVTVTLIVDSMLNHPELQTLMTNSISTENSKVIESRPVVDYLLDNLGDYEMTENTIPVFLWSWDDDLWLTDEGVLGVAMDDGNGNPAMVAMGYNPTMGNSNEGYTITIIHEIGHMIGFRHPHDGFSFDSFFDTGNGHILDWLRDFISTPMTYGQVDSSFSTFDIDNMDRAFTYERINSTWWDLYYANLTLANKGYTSFDLINHSSIEIYLSWSFNNISIALNEFENEEFFSAFYYANMSYIAAEQYLELTNSLEKYVSPPSSSTTSETTTDTTPTKPDTSAEVDSPVEIFPVLIGIFIIPVLIRIKTKILKIKLK